MKWKTNHIKFFFLFAILLCGNVLFAQKTTKITGLVVDSLTNKPIPFVNAYLKGTSVGAVTGFDGRFVIKTSVKADTLLVSYIGYKPWKAAIKTGAFQHFDIKLQSANIELAAVVIHPGENPAHILLRKVIAHKEENSGYNLESYEYRLYNKLQMDANNITDEFKNRKAFKPFKFIFDNVDTSTINGKTYLPLLLAESVSEYYFRTHPQAEKEVVVASRLSGVDNETVAQYLGDMYQKVNIYDNYIRIFNKNFTSPIADFGLRTYRYYLIDSANIDGHWCYQLMFKPKRKQEATFTGEMWIADTTFAVKRVSMKIQKVNLNFVNAMAISQEFKLIDGKYWMLYRDNFVVDFNIVENTKRILGFFGHKTTIHENIVVNKYHPDEFYRSPTKVVVKEDAWGKPEEYWDTVRAEGLSGEEKQIYKTIDTLSNMPIVKTYYRIMGALTSGYYHTDIIDYGQWYRFYSYNAIEGNRFRVGARTSNKLSEKIRVYGHLAYGTLDERFKYGMGVILMQKKNPRRAFNLYYKNDMEQLGAGIGALKTDNILSSLLRAEPNDKLTMVEMYKLSYEYEWFNGFSNTLTFRHRVVSPFANTKFELYPTPGDTALRNHITTSEVEFKLHFAYRETFFYGTFNRTSLGTKFPRIDIRYTYGIPDILNSDFEYHKLQIAMRQRFNVWGIGFSRYVISWGKIWGRLPYNLLEVHPGNETYFYDRYAYNGLNYYEFISDEWLSVAYSHNFQGLLFNHIPLLRKLKWREVVYGKVLFGNLSNENYSFYKFPDVTHFLSEPYYEAGFAIENIFKVLRLDFGWRLNYLNVQEVPDIRAFRVRFNMVVDF